MKKAAILAVLVTLAMLLGGCQFSVGAGVDSRIYDGEKDPRWALMRQPGYREKTPVTEVSTWSTVERLPELPPLKGEEPVRSVEVAAPAPAQQPAPAKRSLLKW